MNYRIFVYLSFGLGHFICSVWSLSKHSAASSFSLQPSDVCHGFSRYSIAWLTWSNSIPSIPVVHLWGMSEPGRPNPGDWLHFTLYPKTFLSQRLPCTTVSPLLLFFSQFSCIRGKPLKNVWSKVAVNDRTYSPTLPFTTTFALTTALIESPCKNCYCMIYDMTTSINLSHRYCNSIVNLSLMHHIIDKVNRDSNRN